MGIRRCIYLFIFSVAVFACDSDDQIFDASPQEREEELLGQYKSILTTPSAGWVMTYLPTNQVGGYTIIAKFRTDGMVELTADVDGYDKGKISNYRVGRSQLPELVFETHTLFHSLYEVGQSTLGAEFEFFFDKVSPEEVVLRSKSDPQNAATRITMRPASQADITGIQERIKHAAYLRTLPYFNSLVVDGKSYNVQLNTGLRIISFESVVDQKTSGNTASATFVLTDAGVTLMGDTQLPDGGASLPAGTTILKSDQNNYVQSVNSPSGQKLGELRSGHKVDYGFYSQPFSGYTKGVFGNINPNALAALSDAQSMGLSSMLESIILVGGGTDGLSNVIRLAEQIPGHIITELYWNLETGRGILAARTRTSEGAIKFEYFGLDITTNALLSRVKLSLNGTNNISEANAAKLKPLADYLTSKEFTVRFSGRREYSNAYLFAFDWIDTENSQNRITWQSIYFFPTN